MKIEKMEKDNEMDNVDERPIKQAVDDAGPT